MDFSVELPPGCDLGTVQPADLVTERVVHAGDYVVLQDGSRGPATR